MKWLVYNLLFCAAFPLLLPGFLVRMCRRGGYRARILDRIALYPVGLFRSFDDAPDGRRPVWIHAVSVGEAQVAGQLMREWRMADPGVRFCFSTTSSTGWKTAERSLGPGDVLIYNPLDFPTFVKAALRRIRPSAVVLTESEIWPNFVRRARKESVPVFLVNARISDRSAPRYRLARWWFGDVLRSMERIFAQSALDRDRLVAAGADPGKIDVSGSFKFDAARRDSAKESELRAWLAECGAPQGGRILLGGSTWPGEDEILLGIARELKDVTLVIAPRHFEKAGDVEANIRKAGFGVVRRSAGAAAGCAGDGARRVYLADTTGELMGLYGLADFVFVGKTLTAKGAQNMIEPCLCGRPTVVGPHTENFRPVMDDLLAARAIVQVNDAEELGKTIAGWAAHGDGGLGERAAKAVAARRGVVAKCAAEMIRAVAARPPAPPDAHGARHSIAKTVLKSLAFAIVLAVAMAAFLRFWPDVAALAGRGGAEKGTPEIPKFRAIRTAQAFIAMVEKPDAVRVFLADGAAAESRSAFASAGLKCFSPDDEKSPDARYDVVFAAGSGALGAGRAEELAAKTSDDGVLAVAVDVSKMDAGTFKGVLGAFPFRGGRLWMTGERDWLLTGRKGGGATKMSAMLEFFSRWASVSPAAEEAGCGSLQEVFANYAGTIADVAPALEKGDLGVEVRPEFFVPEEVPDVGWVVPDDMDADIVEMLADRIRALQENRRDILKACMRSRDRDGEGDAIAAWTAAFAKNPHDMLLLDRLYRLAVNARTFETVGNFGYAAKCYETMVAVNPSDVRVVEAYGRCLKALGRRELAESVLSKAMDMKFRNARRRVIEGP